MDDRLSAWRKRKSHNNVYEMAPVLLSRLRHSQLMGGTSGPRSFSPLLSNGLRLLLRPGNPY